MARAGDVAGVPVLVEAAPVADGKALLELADHAKNRLGEGVVVLGAAGDGRANLVVSVAPAVVERGVKAGAIVKLAAGLVGGGGGGRDTMAQAGGRRPEHLGEALAAARAEVERLLGG
jgi:alanyl-tRNA synthetase